jgi:hypothetical protein
LNFWVLIGPSFELLPDWLLVCYRKGFVSMKYSKSYKQIWLMVLWWSERMSERRSERRLEHRSVLEIGQFWFVWVFDYRVYFHPFSVL